MSLNFDILIDSSIVELSLAPDTSVYKNKSLVSIINDFEDGKWRTEKFHDFVWDNIAETALSLNERSALSARPRSLLRAAAKNLRLADSDEDIGRGSELAEIVLYGVMKHKYKALPVVPKIFYKQNSRDNAKGADSVHIRLEGANDFSLWFGETKFYENISDVRLPKVVASVEAALDTGKLKKENSIVTSVSDLDQLDLPGQQLAKIKAALSNLESIDRLKPKIHIPILLLHECPHTAAAIALDDAYVEKVVEHHKNRAASYFKKQAARLAKKVFKYDTLQFHLILFPVPCKREIVDAFLSAATSWRQ